MTDDLTGAIVGMTGVAATAGIGLMTVDMISRNMPANKKRKKYKRCSNKK